MATDLAPDAGRPDVATSTPMTHGTIAPATPQAAAAVFGEHLAQAEAFVRILADTGISRGLIGPREAPRLWDRHVLNCAVVERLIPRRGPTQRVVDVGSGAGLPGIALAIARPDLEVHLVEPLARRTAWLRETVEELALRNVTVHTARAESMWDSLEATYVTARAVAGIVQLAEWTLPILSDGGSLLALKGSKAYAELDDNREALRRLGVTDAAIEEVGGDVLAEPTTVVRLSVAHAVDGRSFRRRAPSSSGSARRRGDRPGGAGRHGPSRGTAGGKPPRDEATRSGGERAADGGPSPRVSRGRGGPAGDGVGRRAASDGPTS